MLITKKRIRFFLIFTLVYIFVIYISDNNSQKREWSTLTPYTVCWLTNLVDLFIDVQKLVTVTTNISKMTLMLHCCQRLATRQINQAFLLRASWKRELNNELFYYLRIIDLGVHLLDNYSISIRIYSIYLNHLYWE